MKKQGISNEEKHVTNVMTSPPKISRDQQSQKRLRFSETLSGFASSLIARVRSSSDGIGEPPSPARENVLDIFPEPNGQRVTGANVSEGRRFPTISNVIPGEPGGTLRNSTETADSEKSTRRFAPRPPPAVHPFPGGNGSLASSVLLPTISATSPSFPVLSIDGSVAEALLATSKLAFLKGYPIIAYSLLQAAEDSIKYSLDNGEDFTASTTPAGIDFSTVMSVLNERPRTKSGNDTKSGNCDNSVLSSLSHGDVQADLDAESNGVPLRRRLAPLELYDIISADKDFSLIRSLGGDMRAAVKLIREHKAWKRVHKAEKVKVYAPRHGHGGRGSSKSSSGSQAQQYLWDCSVKADLPAVMACVHDAGLMSIWLPGSPQCDAVTDVFPFGSICSITLPSTHPDVLFRGPGFVAPLMSATAAARNANAANVAANIAAVEEAETVAAAMKTVSLSPGGGEEGGGKVGEGGGELSEAAMLKRLAGSLSSKRLGRSKLLTHCETAPNDSDTETGGGGGEESGIGSRSGDSGDSGDSGGVRVEEEIDLGGGGSSLEVEGGAAIGTSANPTVTDMDSAVEAARVKWMKHQAAWAKVLRTGLAAAADSPSAEAAAAADAAAAAVAAANNLPCAASAAARALLRVNGGTLEDGGLVLYFSSLTFQQAQQVKEREGARLKQRQMMGAREHARARARGRARAKARSRTRDWLRSKISSSGEGLGGGPEKGMVGSEEGVGDVWINDLEGAGAPRSGNWARGESGDEGRSLSVSSPPFRLGKSVSLGGRGLCAKAAAVAGGGGGEGKGQGGGEDGKVKAWLKQGGYVKVCRRDIVGVDRDDASLRSRNNRLDRAFSEKSGLVGDSGLAPAAAAAAAPGATEAAAKTRDSEGSGGIPGEVSVTGSGSRSFRVGTLSLSAESSSSNTSLYSSRPSTASQSSTRPGRGRLVAPPDLNHAGVGRTPNSPRGENFVGLAPHRLSPIKVSNIAVDSYGVLQPEVGLGGGEGETTAVTTKTEEGGGSVKVSGHENTSAWGEASEVASLVSMDRPSLLKCTSTPSCTAAVLDGGGEGGDEDDVKVISTSAPSSPCLGPVVGMLTSRSFGQQGQDGHGSVAAAAGCKEGGRSGAIKSEEAAVSKEMAGWDETWAKLTSDFPSSLLGPGEEAVDVAAGGGGDIPMVPMSGAILMQPRTIGSRRTRVRLMLKVHFDALPAGHILRPEMAHNYGTTALQLFGTRTLQNLRGYGLRFRIPSKKRKPLSVKLKALHAFRRSPFAKLVTQQQRVWKHVAQVVGGELQATVRAAEAGERLNDDEGSGSD